MSKSLKRNFFLYAVKEVLTILMPLISYPYITRKLGVENIGVLNYAVSIVAYFKLLSSLGISSYAVREGAKYRTDKEKLSGFASEVLSLNLASTIIACIACIIFSGVAIDYVDRRILLIYLLTIPLTTVGVEWVYILNEDFGYITARSIFIQIISLALTLIFVKYPEDYLKYALINVISNGGASVFNFIHSYKYVKWDFKIKPRRTIKHLKPVVVIFGITVAAEIYLNMDATLLGTIAGMTATGLYSVANKLINLISRIASSLRTVMLPRLSFAIKDDSKSEFEKLNNVSIVAMLLFVIPICAGLIILGQSGIEVLFGKEYIPATRDLQILSVSLIFGLVNGYITGQIFLPLKHEVGAFAATCAGALINLVVDFTLIPAYKDIGAAVGTLFAEMAVLVICLLYSKHYNIKVIDSCFVIKNLIQSVFSATLMSFALILVVFMVENKFIILLISIPLGGFIYFMSLYMMKNDMVYSSLKRIYKNIGRKNAK